MLRLQLSLFVVSVSCFLPGVQRPSVLHHQALSRPAVVMQAEGVVWMKKVFGELQANVMGVGSTSEPASDAEMVEYCRDDESVGCDIDMLTRLVQQHAASKATSHAKVAKVQWSLDIDEAVQNMQPQM